MDEPRSVLAAPSHPDPYAWYARLPPIAFDAELGLWVVAAPNLVAQALAQPLLRVRPPSEPVPQALVGRPTGEVFACLVRMNDGEFHARHRPEVAAAAARFDMAAVDAAAVAATSGLAARTAPDALLSALTVQAMARLLGVQPPQLDSTVAWVHDFTRGIAAGASADALDRSDAAVCALLAQGEREGLALVASANRVAMMQQALDATTGLIGNAIVAWQAQPAALEGTAFIEHAARTDPAVHNTRRFAAGELELGGQRIAAGQGLVLLLVGADAGLGFGQGAHACPGERIALTLAAAALRTLAALGALERFGPVRGYRPLPNARIPLFGAAAPPGTRDE
jgi:cytochrome P450